MDIRLTSEVEGRSKERVVFTGTILPATKEQHSSIEHCCEGKETVIMYIMCSRMVCTEFTTSEVADLCTALEGLPLCLEHGDGMFYYT